jgi:hypothetical protein
MFVLGSNDVFDLSQEIESSTFFRGLVFPQYFSNYAYYYEDGMKIIFPKSYYLYYYKFADYTNQPYKLIYNIMYPPVKDIVRIYNTQITFDTFEINKYFPAYPNVPGR